MTKDGEKEGEGVEEEGEKERRNTHTHAHAHACTHTHTHTGASTLPREVAFHHVSNTYKVEVISLQILPQRK